MTKRLYRSKTDKKISGVCGGMADYFAIDPGTDHRRCDRTVAVLCDRICI